jgi:tetratricopeptide (TPR) repeat protein
MFTWLKAKDAVDAGAALADSFPVQTTSELLKAFVLRAAKDVSARQLNFYKRVRFANALKWRLLEKGVPVETAHDVTQTILIQSSGLAPPTAAAVPAAPGRLPKDSGGLNTVGVELSRQGRYQEAKKHFQRALTRNPNNTDALCNLGSLFATQGRFADAENYYRRALSLKRADLIIRANLGQVLAHQGQLDGAREEFAKVLKTAPRHAPALTGLGHLERAAGRFTEAEQMYRRALEADPGLAAARAGIAGSRRMTVADSQWLTDAQEAAAKLTNPTDEADLRFAIGKYFNDVGDYAGAFGSYHRANELLKPLAVPFDERSYSRFVNDMTCVYTAEALAQTKADGSSSTRPVFVLGMPRSGTSLVEQILASHPAVAGAGEFDFWSDVVGGDEARIRKEVLASDRRRKLATDYLQVLKARHRTAGYVVEKTPRNADYLGLIHSVFPNARIIYLRRDPIDTCLSCYFQNFSLALNFKFDLNDLAAYYRQHARLMAHWRQALPAGAILDVPYEELVSGQEAWTRRILAFLGLEWDVRCLRFNENRRPVVTASSWQVRQPIYGDSVKRWRRYGKFVEPLRKLASL